MNMNNQKFSSLERKLNIFSQFSGFEFLSQLENCLLVFDDSCEELLMEKEISKLATAGSHRNISDNYVKHNLFQQRKWSGKIDPHYSSNTNHIILFKSSRDIQQITYIGKQLNNIIFLNKAMN